MSQQHIDLWKATAAAFDQRYQAIAEQWDTATPCEGWTVKDLVDHTVSTQAMFIGPVAGAEVAEGADWAATYAAISAALDVEGAIDGMTNHPMMGEVPKGMIIGIGISDLLVHTWDLSRAIGVDETLPPEAVAATHAGLQQFPPEMREGRFGPIVESAEGADAQTAMLNFSGRVV